MRSDVDWKPESLVAAMAAILVIGLHSASTETSGRIRWRYEAGG